MGEQYSKNCWIVNFAPDSNFASDHFLEILVFENFENLLFEVFSVCEILASFLILDVNFDRQAGQYHLFLYMWTSPSQKNDFFQNWISLHLISIHKIIWNIFGKKLKF